MKTITYKTAQKEDAQAILNYLDQIGKESDNLTFGEEGIGYTLEDEEKMLESLAENRSEYEVRIQRNARSNRR